MSAPLLLVPITETPFEQRNESVVYDLIRQGCTAPAEYDWINFWREPRLIALLMRPAISLQEVAELERKIRGLVAALLLHEA